jgi:hypothetical protein
MGRRRAARFCKSRNAYQPGDGCGSAIGRAILKIETINSFYINLWNEVYV